ncbi:response regulator [Kiritimatiellaeota bacterium B1221]|nr:response regulator [Kiritimatiellaeota bacterium B1221]
MSLQPRTRPIEILLIEDSPTDRLIAVEALADAKILNSLNVAENGVEAMEYLQRKGKYTSVSRPDLILLDLNLPKMDGREVLKAIKSDPLLAFIPVVVMTTSKADEDVVRAYGLHANSYISKPVDFPRFTEIIRAIENYWFEIVTLPSEWAVQNYAEKAVAPISVHKADSERPMEVILVEDNPVDVLLIQDALKHSAEVKFHVTHVNRMAAFREQLENGGTYDVALVDLGLPDSQGLDTYRQARDLASCLPIIVLTGLDDEVTGMGALREGAQDYLVKGQLSEYSLSRALRYALEKKEVEERLRHAQKMEAMGQLSAGVAHDFNNILSVILGRIGMLIPQLQNEEQVDSAKEIELAAERAANLTRQLLTFSRQQVMQLKPLDLNQVVGNITKMLRRLLGENILLELQLGSNLSSVEADLGMIEQVILNLAVNARDAIQGGGKLSIHTESVEVGPEDISGHKDAYPGRFVRFSMVDTGVGMSKKVQTRIFEPFFTTKDVDKGTGLGLATILSIVQQHRGWVEVDSIEGKGTTFFVYLPASDVEVGEGVRAEPQKSQGGSETILVVEDEASLLQMAKLILEKGGYHVLGASSGDEAILVWEAHADEIDLVLTDMIMPGGMTGRQLAEKLQKRKPALKTLFTSGYSEDFLSEDFVLEEGVNFLQKPYEMKTLLNTIRSQLDKG